jgi:hypothetical protein
LRQNAAFGRKICSVTPNTLSLLNGMTDSLEKTQPIADAMRDYTLGVRQWAAVLQEPAGERTFGAAGGEDIIPSGVRRRLGKLERLAVRSMLSVLKSGTTSELIFCSRYGNLETLTALLQSIGAGEPMSPMAFSGSVHNAAPGMVGQIRKEKIAHTALAAGENTLRAGLVEAYARLAADGCPDVIVAYADLPLTGVYADFENDSAPGGVGLAMRLVLEEAGSGAVEVEPGRAGAQALVERLGVNGGVLAVGGGPWSMSA